MLSRLYEFMRFLGAHAAAERERTYRKFIFFAFPS
jgi:hypothetical protein